MMCKKDFEELAKVLGEHEASLDIMYKDTVHNDAIIMARNSLYSGIVRLCSKQNEKFNSQKFYAAIQEVYNKKMERNKIAVP